MENGKRDSKFDHYKSLKYMRNSIKLILASLALTGTQVISFGAQAQSSGYPIDCAILLCLAGGWPSSAECTAAKAEFIRRITPYPVEPPLQIWRCPLGVSYDVPETLTDRIWKVAAAQPFAPPALPVQSASDAQHIADRIILAQQADVDISTSAFDFVRSVRVWDVQFYSYEKRGRDDDCYLSFHIQLGTYGTQGDFKWEEASLGAVPSWVGIPRRASCEPSVFYRGVGVEWNDYEGNHGYEVVRY